MRILFIGLFLATFMLAAKAEMEFPDYDSLSPEQQKALGFSVKVFIGQNGPNSTFRLIIPPADAKYCHGARLYLRDKQKNTVAEINADLMKGKDGSLSIGIDITSVDAELVVYMDEPPGLGKFDFGGLTFKVPTKA